MFDINNSRDFYQKLLADFDDFIGNLDSGRHAMNYVITAYHMHEWVWNDYLKQDAVIRAKMGIKKDKKAFEAWINRSSVWFRWIEELANGSKHFGRPSSFRIPLVNDYVEEGYVGPGYFESYFAIDQGENVNPGRYMPLSFLFEVVLRFWRDFFALYSPYKELPKGETKLMDEQ